MLNFFNQEICIEKGVKRILCTWDILQVYTYTKVQVFIKQEDFCDSGKLNEYGARESGQILRSINFLTQYMDKKCTVNNVYHKLGGSAIILSLIWYSSCIFRRIVDQSRIVSHHMLSLNTSKKKISCCFEKNIAHWFIGQNWPTL